MLLKHQCTLDLKRNCLVIGTTGTETPFLSEADLPPCARIDSWLRLSQGLRLIVVWTQVSHKAVEKEIHQH